MPVLDASETVHILGKFYQFFPVGCQMVLKLNSALQQHSWGMSTFQVHWSLANTKPCQLPVHQDTSSVNIIWGKRKTAEANKGSFRYGLLKNPNSNSYVCFYMWKQITHWIRSCLFDRYDGCMVGVDRKGPHLTLSLSKHSLHDFWEAPPTWCHLSVQFLLQLITQLSTSILGLDTMDLQGFICWLVDLWRHLSSVGFVLFWLAY